MSDSQTADPVFPSGWPDAGENLMSNFDGEVNEATAEMLRSGQFVADYPGWNFHAVCWFSDGQFHARIKQYCAVVGYRSAPTPKELMQAICEKWGYD